MKKFIQLIAIIALTASCTTQNDPIIKTPKDAVPIALRVGMEKLVNQDNEFAFDLLKKTIASSGETNVFISPLSVSIALGMAWNGASGETKTEMETAMKMSGMSVEDMNNYYKIMQTTLPEIDPRGPSSGYGHIIRGGSWGAHPEDCQIAKDGRMGYPNDRSAKVGFRLVLIP